MLNTTLNAHIAVISHWRPENVKKILEVLECDATFYVNYGEGAAYLLAGAKYVVECGTNICEARNAALRDARQQGLPSIQVSDDLKSIRRINPSKKQHPMPFELAADQLLRTTRVKGYVYGGVAINNNPLNYTGQDFSFDKLIVNDLICVMPHPTLIFDKRVPLKEDYAFTIQNLLEVGGVVRCNYILCDFPHRQNAGGANTYRNAVTEAGATERLMQLYGRYIKPHPTRPGQVALNYPAIRAAMGGQGTIFDFT